MRNRCNGEGYESVALIPISTGNEIIGLLQLNDHRPDQFAPELIRSLETLCAAIGSALARKEAEGALRFRNLVLDTQQEASLDGILVVDVNGTIVSANRRFSEMWGVPRAILQSKSDVHVLQSVADRLADAEAFAATVARRSMHLPARRAGMRSC